MHTCSCGTGWSRPTFQNDPARASRKWHFARQGAALLRRRGVATGRRRTTALLRQRTRSSRRSRSTRRRRTSCGRGRSSGCVPSTREMLLVASFRDPIERAFSQWSMGRKQKNAYPEFRDAIEQYDDEPMLDRVPPGAGRWSVHRRSMVIRGLYGAQLERGLRSSTRRSSGRSSTSPSSSATTQRRWTSSPTSLGLHRFRQLPRSSANPTPEAARGHRRRATTTSSQLVERYSDDLALFERLSGFDVSTWPTRRIAVGETDRGGAGRQVRPQVRQR